MWTKDGAGEQAEIRDVGSKTEAMGTGVWNRPNVDVKERPFPAHCPLVQPGVCHVLGPSNSLQIN